jgi:hypothetical protein
MLKIVPDDELRFHGPFTSVVTSHLKLTNPSDKTLCFKVKTTAPKRYCVRPNSGCIKSRESVDIAVMLQPFQYDPEEKNKHKFMVQSLVAPDGEDGKNLEALFKAASSESLMDSKLKCVFEMPERETEVVTASKVNESYSAPPAATTTAATTALTAATGVATTIPSQPSSLNNNDHEKFLNEISRLQKENSRLKEQEVRLKKMTVHSVSSGVGIPSGTSSTIGIKEPDTNSFSMALAALFVLLALISGVLVGKLVL